MSAISEEKTYFPKGGMCMSCVRKLEVGFCKSLDFKSMPAIKRDHMGFTTVKCLEFQRDPKIFPA